VMQHYGFTKGGATDDFRAFLEIAISVCDGAHAAAKKKALGLLAMVLAQRGRVVSGFPVLDFDQVVYQLTLRVLEPRLVDQGKYGLCGPAAFIILLAKTDPTKYVKIAIELLTAGESTIRGMRLKPNEGIRKHRPDGTPHADWMVLASVRSSDELLHQGMKTGEYGGTNYGEMVDWCKRAGYGVVVGAFAAHLTGALKTFSSLPLIKQLDSWSCCEFHPQKPRFLNGIDLTRVTDQAFNLFLADRFCRNRWKVFLLVSEKYTQTSGTEDPLEKRLAPWRDLGVPNLEAMRESSIKQVVGSESNHWILVKEIRISGGTVRITRYSWGSKDTTAPISLELFYTIYAGFVAVLGRRNVRARSSAGVIR